MPENWDAIVIGSGLGGLTAATVLANRNQRVLVLERLGNFGGAATIYRHGALTMEASLHEIDGETVRGEHGLFARLGLVGMVEPIETDVFYEVRAAPLSAPVQVPHGLDAAREAIVKSLPASAARVERYFNEAQSVFGVLHAMEEIGARGPGVLFGALFGGGLLDIVGAVQKTVAEKFDAAFGADEAPKFVFGAPLAYFDDDPARLSYLLYAGIWSRYVEGGSYYFRGGSRALTMALLKRVKDAGGDACRKASVTDILLDARGRAAGVAYLDEQGQRIEAHAPLVFAGAAPEVVAAMLPVSQRAPFLHRFEGYEPSVSLFNVSLGLTRPAADFGVSAYSTFLYPDDIMRFAEWPAAAARFGREPASMPPYVLADYGRLDAAIRKPDEPYLVSLCGVDRLSWWDGLDESQETARRKRWIDALIADVDRRYPGFAGAVTHAEIATARTMKRFLGTPHGEVYGFRQTPARLFGRPPNAATTVPGLLLSSAYTVSGGYAGAMHGGLIAADAAARGRRNR